MLHEYDGAGQIPVLEDSEEIRLQLFSLLIDVLLPECSLQALQAIVDPLQRVWIFLLPRSSCGYYGLLPKTMSKGQGTL